MKIILRFTFLFFCITNYAQIKFEKGYIITNANEKIECFIKNVDWKDNPTNIEYKINQEETKTNQANISNLAEFSIYGECKYQRFEINIEKSGDDLRFLTSKKDPIWEKQTALLRVLVEGDAKLYAFHENNLVKYFYKTSDSDISQLISIKYLTDDRNGNQIDSYSSSIKTNNEFRKQLYNHVKCENMTIADFEKISYSRADLVKHFIKYNTCMGNDSSNYVAKAEKNIFNFKISAGISTANLSIKDPNQYFNLSTDINGKIIFNLGVEVEYILPFNKNKWGLFINPSYHKFEATKSYINPNGLTPGNDLEHKAEVKYNSLEIPIGLRHYIFLNDNSKLFINAIYVINFSSGSEIIFDDEQIFDIKPRNNAAMGIGYCYKNKFSAELRANFAREILGTYIEWNAQYNTAGILLSYNVF